MKRSIVAVLMLATAGLGAGCQSHSIRPGIWTLSFHAQDSRTQESLDAYLESQRARVHQVEVLVEPGDETPGEVVEVRPITSRSELGTKRTGTLKPLFGDIAPGSDEINLRGGDETWEFRMVGYISDSEHIIGRRFLARMRVEDEAIEGRWSMDWVSD